MSERVSTYEVPAADYETYATQPRQELGYLAIGGEADELAEESATLHISEVTTQAMGSFIDHARANRPTEVDLPE